MPPILVSACLCGVVCRYDGRAAMHPRFIGLREQANVILVCPEVLGGLTVPRTPCEIFQGRVVDRDGCDVTAQFSRGAEETLRIARENGVAVAVLKERSPSCGSSCIYDGNFTGTCRPGQGITAALLVKNGITAMLSG